MNDIRLREWVRGLKARGLDDAARIALDAMGALGPLAAQALYVGQPVLRVLAAGVPVDELAEALEQPGGADRLRALLDEE